MNNIEQRLTSCFQVVFPDLPADAIPQASQERVPAWDSVASITLVSVLEDEFKTQIDLEQLHELDSFPRILAYLNENSGAQ